MWFLTPLTGPGPYSSRHQWEHQLTSCYVELLWGPGPCCNDHWTDLVSSSHVIFLVFTLILPGTWRDSLKWDELSEGAREDDFDRNYLCIWAHVICWSWKGAGQPFNPKKNVRRKLAWIYHCFWGGFGWLHKETSMPGLCLLPWQFHCSDDSKLLVCTNETNTFHSILSVTVIKTVNNNIKLIK